MHRRWLLAPACAILAWMVWIGLRPPEPPPSRVYRIGFQQSPPRQFVSADGKPYGPSIDVANEAARRAGIVLQWVWVPEPPDRPLAAGTVDLWPIVAATPDRLG